MRLDKLLTLLVASALLACSEDPGVDPRVEEVHEGRGRVMERLGEPFLPQRDVLAESLEAQLGIMRDRLEELVEGDEPQTEEARRALEERVRALEQQLELGRQRLEELRRAGEEGLEEARERALRALEALQGE